LKHLKQTLSKALAQTMPFFEPIAIAFDWVHQAATLLDNDLKLNGQQVRQRVEQLLQTRICKVVCVRREILQWKPAFKFNSKAI